MRSFKVDKIIMAALFCAGTLLAPWPTSTAEAYDLEATKTLYLEKCAKCHGETGKGDGRKAKTLKKKPRDYTDTAKMSELTDEDLVTSITEGKKPMPSYKKGKKKLTNVEIVDLVTFIRTFAQ